MRRSHSRAMVPKEARTGVCAGVLCASICVSMRLRLAPAGRGVVRSWHAHGPLDCATGWPRGIRHECRHVDRFVKCASCVLLLRLAVLWLPAQSLRSPCAGVQAHGRQWSLEWRADTCTRCCVGLGSCLHRRQLRRPRHPKEDGRRPSVSCRQRHRASVPRLALAWAYVQL